MYVYLQFGFFLVLMSTFCNTYVLTGTKESELNEPKQRERGWFMIKIS